MTNPTLSVWFIEDHTIYRETVSNALLARSEIGTLLDFNDAETALERLQHGVTKTPDVILLDLGLPGASGLEVIGTLKKRLPETNILILTVFDDKPKVFDAIASGASGYLLKSSTIDEIVQAVLQVHNGGSPLTPQIARFVISAFTNIQSKKAVNELTLREREILHHLSEGLVKKQIAEALNISAHTVDYHIRKIYGKLQVNTLSGAMSKAIKQGFV